MLTIVKHLPEPSNDDGISWRSTSWPHGVQHLSCRGNGELYWKDTYIQTLRGAIKDVHFEYVQELGLICRHLDRLKIPVNTSTTGSHVSWFATMKPDEPYKELLARCPDIHVGCDALLLKFRRAACEFDGDTWLYYLFGSSEWCKRWQFTTVLQKQALGYTSLATSEYADVVSCLKYFNVPFNLLTLMADELNPRMAK